MEHTLTIYAADAVYTLRVAHGANLRQTLLTAGFSPYAALTRRANCGGRGICATCGVWLAAGAPAPTHWHDRLAAEWGYPRLSCQISIADDLTVRLVDNKLIWGARDPERRWREDEP